MAKSAVYTPARYLQQTRTLSPNSASSSSSAPVHSSPFSSARSPLSPNSTSSSSTPFSSSSVSAAAPSFPFKYPLVWTAPAHSLAPFHTAEHSLASTFPNGRPPCPLERLLMEQLRHVAGLQVDPYSLSLAAAEAVSEADKEAEARGTLEPDDRDPTRGMRKSRRGSGLEGAVMQVSYPADLKRRLSAGSIKEDGVRFSSATPPSSSSSVAAPVPKLTQSHSAQESETGIYEDNEALEDGEISYREAYGWRRPGLPSD
eukprot:GILI01002365.1.p1 GENE.GILI01002365.1~~GILI01002365.1.p1  ORF type:complete len:270 (+),score=82.12 GILI01002365.1:39-812(+)